MGLVLGNGSSIFMVTGVQALRPLLELLLAVNLELRSQELLVLQLPNCLVQLPFPGLRSLPARRLDISKHLLLSSFSNRHRFAMALVQQQPSAAA